MFRQAVGSALVVKFGRAVKSAILLKGMRPAVVTVAVSVRSMRSAVVVFRQVAAFGRAVAFALVVKFGRAVAFAFAVKFRQAVGFLLPVRGMRPFTTMFA